MFKEGEKSMKKTAVLLYNTCCLFELTVALEMLQMAQKPVVYFAKDLKPIRTEEGMLIVADSTFEQLNIEEYDSLLITGATDAKETVEDKVTQEFVSKFHDASALIGAISIAPLFLLKLGYLKGKPFMIGIEKSDLYEEGFKDEETYKVLSLRRFLETFLKYHIVVVCIYQQLHSMLFHQQFRFVLNSFVSEMLLQHFQ